MKLFPLFILIALLCACDKKTELPPATEADSATTSAQHAQETSTNPTEIPLPEGVNALDANIQKMVLTDERGVVVLSANFFAPSDDYNNLNWLETTSGLFFRNLRTQFPQLHIDNARFTYYGVGTDPIFLIVLDVNKINQLDTYSGVLFNRVTDLEKLNFAVSGKMIVDYCANGDAAPFFCDDYLPDAQSATRHLSP